MIFGIENHLKIYIVLCLMVAWRIGFDFCECELFFENLRQTSFTSFPILNLLAGLLETQTEQTLVVLSYVV